jgi:glycosyltransferase involved in cell wall biosynthesis
LAKGEFIAILDSDDYWAPNTISKHVIALKQDISKLGSIGHVQFFLEKNQSPPPEFKLSLLDQSHLAYMPGCFLCRRTLYDKIGLYETTWKVASDMIWFSKVKELKDDLILLESVVLYKRVHNKNLSYTSVKQDIYGSELLTLLHSKIRKLKQ